MNKSFRSRKHALNQKTIYLYCPESAVQEVLACCEDYDFEVVINDYSLRTFSRKVICHYHSSMLDKEQKLFLIRAMEYGSWVEPLVSYLDDRNSYSEVKLLNSGYFLHQKAFSILSTQRNQYIKRAIDLVLSLTALILLFPILILVAIAIRLESKGSIIYKQMRVGQFNQEFNVFKFRSMVQNAENGKAQWAKKNDPRITKVGSFIRKTRLDELPQLINVIKGEMSLVGPRPEREVFITELEKEIPYYRFRHSVKPGITGLAQVSYPYGDSIEDAIWKHKYDIYYIKHHTILNDLVILIKTVKVVLFGMGR
ncbi:exopolysaccharide biosynthesis protein [Pseudoalteromonas luteoviolacea]|uniref:Exopolysaccharide biosynthesis protein n=1 Tax=Pseudoalteromonas luteoviolacea TaxID=43657 RepID=A0A0C1QGP6_9GAMM|nr:exopolysaccharide biosynthesis protein [Pseudoalteromonas luteoviolacea]